MTTSSRCRMNSKMMKYHAEKLKCSHENIPDINEKDGNMYERKIGCFLYRENIFSFSFHISTF